MSERKGKGVNVKRIFINANQQIGIYQLCGKLEISDKSAMLLAMSKGLEAFGFYTKEQYENDEKKYAEPLVKKVERKRKQREALAQTKEEAQEVVPKPIPITIEDFKNKWSSDLNITELENEYIAKPKNGIWSNNLDSIAEDVRALNGMYVYESGNPHFKIPKGGKKE